MANETRAQNFSLSELNKYIPSVEILNIDISDDLIAEIKKEVENKILVSNRLRLNTGDSEKFFQIKIERKEKRIIWNNTDNKFIFSRFLLYAKCLIDNTPPRQYGSLRQSVFCFGQVSADDTKSNGNIDYVNKLCNEVGISFSIQTPIVSDEAAQADDVFPLDEDDAIRIQTSAVSEAEALATASPLPIITEQEKDASDEKARQAVELHQAGKTKSIKEQERESKKQAKSAPKPEPEQAPEENPESPVVTPLEIGTSFLAYGFDFVLYKPSEAYKKPPRLAIIKDYLYADTLNILYGQAGSKKTFLAIWEAVSLVIGKELFGMPILSPDRKVLYISLEMPSKDIADRIDGMTRLLNPADRNKVDENLLIISAEDTEHMNARNGDFLKALESVCKEYHFTDIYIDAFADFIAGLNIRDEGQMGDVINNLRGFSLKNHIAFHIIHHGIKPTKDSQGSMAGIHTIRDLVDHVYLLRATSETELFLTAKMSDDYSAKSRYGMPTSMNLRFDYSNGFSFSRIQGTETASFLERSSFIYGLIEEHQGITANELRELDHNANDHSKVRDSMVGLTIICNKEKRNGQTAKCYYTSEHWRDREENTLLFS